MEFQEVKRIYHPYWRWEDYKNGFYDNCEVSKKTEFIKKSVKLLSSKELTAQYMSSVVENWQFSCEHNLTNTSLNRIAWLGQAACCFYEKIPSTITMEAWSFLTKEQQSDADLIAYALIQKWISNNKNTQLCLNFI